MANYCCPPETNNIVCQLYFNTFKNDQNWWKIPILRSKKLEQFQKGIGGNVYQDWMFYVFPELCAELLMPDVLILYVGGALRKCLSLEGGALMNRVSAYKRGSRELPSSPPPHHHNWVHGEETGLRTRKRASPGYDYAGSLILNFSAPRTVRKKFCCL